MNGTAAEPVAGPKTKNATSANATVRATSVNGTAAEPVAGPKTKNATSANATSANATESGTSVNGTSAEPVAEPATENATSANATVQATHVNGTAAEPVAGPKTKNATSANATVPAASVNGTSAEPVAEPATENATVPLTGLRLSRGSRTTRLASLAGNAARQTSSAVTLATDSTGLVGASVSSALSDEIFDARLRAMFAEAKGRYEAAADRTRHESLERYVQSATRPSGRSDAAAAASAEASLGRKARAGSFSSTLGAVEVAEASAKEREMGLRRVSRAQDVCTRPLGAAHSGRSGLSDVIKRQLFEIHFKHESGLAAEEDANVAVAAARDGATRAARRLLPRRAHRVSKF